MHFHMHVNIKKYYIYPVFKNLPFHYSYYYRITSYCICFFPYHFVFKKRPQAAISFLHGIAVYGLCFKYNLYAL